MADSKCSQVWQSSDKIRNPGYAIVREVQDTEVLHPGNLFGDVGEALMAQVKLPEVWRNHVDALTLRGRTMEDSDVKQRNDDLARHG